MRNAWLFVVVLFGGCVVHVPDSITHLPEIHSQAILVEPLSTSIHKARLSLWEKENSDWQRVYQYSAVIGRTGVAAPGAKKEGDGHTPYGVYDVKTAFGYAQNIPTGLSYKQVTDNDFWVDDPQSPQYNQWVTGKPLANSWEILKRKDNLYRYAAIIEYNIDPIIKNAGSAIFMHVWRRYNYPTAGCVALAERNIKKILKRLNISEHPVMIISGD